MSSALNSQSRNWLKIIHQNMNQERKTMKARLSTHKGNEWNFGEIG